MFNLSRTIRSALLIVSVWLVALERTVEAQTVDLSLNIIPTTFGSPNSGGTWALFAKTNVPNGIAGIDVTLTNINRPSVGYGGGINAALLNGKPYVFGANGDNSSNSPSDLFHYQDLTLPSVIVGIGTAALNSGPDQLGDPIWNTAMRIALGSYTSTAPIFSVGFTSRANVFALGTPMDNDAIPATTVTTIVRTAVSAGFVAGDFTRDGHVNATDVPATLAALVNLNSYQSANSLNNANLLSIGDVNTSGAISNADLQALSTKLKVGNGSTAAVPEPASVQLLVIALAIASAIGTKRYCTPR